MKTINYGAVQERSLWIESSGKALGRRRELNWTLTIGEICGRGEKGTSECGWQKQHMYREHQVKKFPDKVREK